MKIRIIIFGLLFYGIQISLKSQDFSAATKGQISTLDFMVGTWKGQGWVFHGDEKSYSSVSETIQYKLDSTILFIEGRGMKELPDGSEIKVHDALAIVSFDPFTKQFSMNSFINKGVNTKASFQVVDEGQVVWSFKVGNKTIRYSLKVEEDVWTEEGEISENELEWTKFFEMSLRRS